MICGVLSEKPRCSCSVIEGMGTIVAATAVPTFMPNESARQMNAVASLIGDERAAKVRAQWGKPLKAIVITGAGVLA